MTIPNIITVMQRRFLNNRNHISKEIELCVKHHASYVTPMQPTETSPYLPLPPGLSSAKWCGISCSLKAHLAFLWPRRYPMFQSGLYGELDEIFPRFRDPLRFAAPRILIYAKDMFCMCVLFFRTAIEKMDAHRRCSWMHGWVYVVCVFVCVCVVSMRECWCLCVWVGSMSRN